MSLTVAKTDIFKKTASASTLPKRHNVRQVVMDYKLWSEFPMNERRLSYNVAEIVERDFASSAKIWKIQVKTMPTCK